METKNIEQSLSEVKKILQENIGERVEIYLFGSVARDEHVTDSDIDILVLVPGKVNTKLEEKIIELVYDVELKWSVVFSVVIYPKEFWASKRAKVMPFYQNVSREARRI
jgi:predicted nucleotidyltransferase